MMLKLYKNEKEGISYWEAWDDKREVIVHWGSVGTKGKTRRVAFSKGETAESVIALESARSRAEGYAEISAEGMATVIVQYRTETWGDEEDLEKRHRVEDILNECLGWTGNGHCDGGDIGSGSINAFSYVVDPMKAGETIISALRKHQLLKGAIVAYHLPDQEDHTVIWPKDFLGEFSII